MKIFQKIKNMDSEVKLRILAIILVILGINGLLFASKFIGLVSWANTQWPTPPAQHQASAGHITEINIEYREPAFNWAGVYGVTLPVDGYDNPQSDVLSPADMREKNLLFACFPDASKYVYTTMVPSVSVNWNSVSAATINDIDAFIGFNGTESSSTSRTFAKTMTVPLGSRSFLAPAVYTNVYGMTNSSTFGVGALKDDKGNLIFVANVAQFTQGFVPNNTFNYQMILPINYKKNNDSLATRVNYYFTSNPLNVECPKGRGLSGETGFIEGNVSDGTTGERLKDAFVTVGEYWTVTDEFGHYKLDAPTGNGSLMLNITAGKDNYETFVGSVTVYVGNTTNYNILLNQKQVFTDVGPGQTDFTNNNVGPSFNAKTKDGEGPGVGPGIGPGIGPYLEEPKRFEGQEFVVSIPKINRRVKLDNFMEETISLYSFKDQAVNIEFSIEGNVSQLIELEREKMLLPAKSSDSLKMKIFGKGPIGVYNGSLKISGSINEIIPIRIELTDKDILNIQTLFLDLEAIDKTVLAGKNLRYRTTLRNLLTDTQYPVNLFYTITDKTGKEIIAVSQENVNLVTTVSLLKNQMLPKTLSPDDYIITVQASYLDLTTTVSTAFSVTLPFYQYMVFGKFPLWWIFVGILLLLLLAGLGYWYYRNQESKKKFHLKVEYDEIPKVGPRNVYVGKIAETDKKAYFNLENFKVHTIVAGTTGGGKSFSAQGIIEEMLLHNVAVIVFDPTAQWTGFLRKMQSKSLLALYPAFGMKPTDAKAFNGNIRMIKDPRELIDIKKYAKPGEIQIFACHKLDPKDMDIYVSNAIKEVFHGNFNESPELRLMLVFDEIHRILPKFGGSGAGFLQIERGCREFRKWGIGIMLISQVLGDFMGEIKANINTEIQMRTRDEGDLERISTRYGKDVLQSLVKATVGSGMIENPNYNRGRPYFISFKPLMHSVERLSDEDIEKYNKYNEMIDQIEFELKQLEEEQGQDVFDMKLELKLSLDKVKGGNFNMVDIYLEGLKPRVEKLWQKLGKTPKKYQVRLVSDADLAAELAKAKAEKAKAEAEEKKKKGSEGGSNGEGGDASKPKELTVLDIRVEFKDAFIFPNGQQVTTLSEFLDVLPSVGPAEFAKCVNKEKHDIADWLKNKFGVPELADKLRPILDHDEVLAALDHEVKKPMKIKELPKPVSTPQAALTQQIVTPIVQPSAPVQQVAQAPIAESVDQKTLEQKVVETPKPVEQKIQEPQKQSIPQVSQSNKTNQTRSWKEIKLDYDKLTSSAEKINLLLKEEKNLPNEPNLKYALAIEYHKVKDYKNAESKYLDTLTLLPNNPKVLGYLNSVRDAISKQNKSLQSQQQVSPTTVNALKQLKPEQYFKLNDGREIKSYDDLKNVIKSMDETLIKQYVNESKNDFASWAESALEDKGLAEKLRHAHTKSELEAVIS